MLTCEPITADEPKTKTLAELRQFLAIPADQRPELGEQPFASVALSENAAKTAKELLHRDRVERARPGRQKELASNEISWQGITMPIFQKRFGQKPKDGWSLYISMHGGGGAPAPVNDSQWENQKRLYAPEEGIYVAPRAPSNTWNLWHQKHIDPLFERLIDDLAIVEDVNRNRVYVMGYSAGGDGVYQLAPRMADRFAAAAMMAGHPNETTPDGLRNLPFALQVGELDAGYGRNRIAKEWESKLKNLRTSDPKGYPHFVKIYPGLGHWMNRKDAIALPWMAKQTRNPTPNKIVWKQDDVLHSHFYWIGVEEDQQIARSLTTATINQQTIDLTSDKVKRLTVYLDDRLIDLSQPITIRWDNRIVFQGTIDRNIATIATTLNDRGDKDLTFSATVTVSK